MSDPINPPAPLDDLRERLDHIDRALLEALARRREVVEQVIRTKETKGDFVRDQDREEALLTERVSLGRELGLDGYFVTKIFQQVLDNSLRIQRDHLVAEQNPGVEREAIRIGYQGTEGAYSHEAARKHFASRLEHAFFRGYSTFRELMEGVQAGGLDFAIVPIENTTAGSINEVYDLLGRFSVSVIGEEVLPIDHCLVALEEVPLGNIRRIYSHQLAIAQCGDFLAGLPGCKVEFYPDTAMAVERVKRANDLSQAAIASEEEARAHGLQILKRRISNRRENYTRFMVVAREAMHYDARIPCKTSLILATKHEEGALVRCLNTLADHHLNLTKLESRPRPNVPWEYLFYIDIEGNVADPEVSTAIDELSRDVSFLKVLGSYPASTTESARPSVPKPGAAPDSSSTKAPPAATARTRKATPPGSRETTPPLDVAIKKGYKLASRAHHPSDSVVRIGDVLVGGGEEFVVMAGPCSVESWEQVRACAELVRDQGGQVLRGGVFKPRTSTYSFQGLGYEGLDLLVRAGEEFDLPVVTEVMHPADVQRVAEDASVLQVGARNMQNFALLREIGQVDRPVLLKRGPMSSIDELLAASEYLLAAGNHQVMLCERGIRTFETATRFTLDIGAIPVLKERTHLPVIVDPSHAAGVRQYVIPLAEAAVAAGADGIIVEFHPAPEQALSDGPQALTFEGFGDLMARIHRLTEALRSDRVGQG
jgi:chorismate mutase/prephenate dehydratase